MEGWLESRGLDVASASQDGTLLRLRNVTVAKASAAFSVPMRTYLVGDERIIANAADPLVPARILPSIQAIVGLADVRARTFHVRSLGEVEPYAGTAPYTPSDLRNAYDVNSVLSSGYDGRSRVVATTTWGSASQSDLDTYDSTYGLPAVSLQTHNSVGGTACGAGDVEWDLDVQMLHALAPAAAAHVYCADSATFSALLTIIGNAVSDNVADVVSSSWGTCEYKVSSSTANAWESKMTTAAAQGQAFFFSSGDGGSRECLHGATSPNVISPGWPATLPHVTAVAGTRLVMSGTAYSGESTWNTCTPCGDGTWQASGGGSSSLFARPSWESTASSSGRASGDISASADPNKGVSVRSGGTWYQVGGTSASSPMVAGMWADLVTTLGRMGNAAQRIWPVGTAPAAATAMRDITTGNNGDYAAGSGYDHPTGLGSPRLAGLLSAIGNLAEPRSVVATGQQQQIMLTWQAPSSGSPSGYKVYRSTVAGGETLLQTLGNVLTFTDPGLPNDATYYYQIAAWTSTSESLRSIEASATTYGPPRAPAAFSAVTGAPGDGIALSWAAPTNNGGSPITKYQVYASPAGVSGTDPTRPARTSGGDVWALQMDVDDRNVPASGRTRDSIASYHATLTNANPVNGKFDGAYEVTGIGSYITVPDTAIYTQGAIAMWVNVSSIAQGGQLFYKQWPGHANMLYLAIAADGTLVFNTYQTQPDLGGVTKVPLNTWVHVAATWGPAGKRIYLNGALEASNTADTSGVLGGYTYSMIGNSPNDVNFVGIHAIFDEVREWNTQLAPDDISNIKDFPYSVAGAAFTLLGSSSGTSLTDASVPGGASRSYQVSATNALGEGPKARPISGVALPASPNAPTALTVQAPATTRGALSLAWSPPPTDITSATTGYRVYRSLTTGAETPLVTLTNVLSYADSGLGDGVTAYYRVSAMNASGEGPRSAETSARTIRTPVDAPRSFTATSGAGVGEITLSWTPPSDDGGSPITGYRVYRAAMSGATVAYADVGDVRSFTDGMLGNGAHYVYRLAALNLVGSSLQANEVSATTFTLPDAPSVAATRGPNAGTITVSWAAPPNNGGAPVTSFMLYASGSTNTETLLGSFPSSTLSFAESGFAPGTPRYYKVSAVNLVGESAQSAEATATTFRLPGAPQAVAAASGPALGNITLTWAAGTNDGRAVITYNLYAGDSSGTESYLANTSALRFVEDHLATGRHRYYAISAVTDVGEGPRSLEVSAFSAQPSPAPTGLMLSHPLGDPTLMLINWTNVPDPLGQFIISAYRVWRQDSSGEVLLDDVPTALGATLTDAMCNAGRTCAYRIAAIGVAGLGASTSRVSTQGTGSGAATPGAKLTSPDASPRLLGHERLALQMDADDHDSPAPGFTRDSSLSNAETRYTKVAQTPGKFGAGYLSYQSNQDLTVPDAITTGLASGTFMMWVRPDQYLPSHGTLFQKALPGVTTELYVGLDPTTGQVTFSTSQAYGSTSLRSATSVPTSRWTHIAVTWSPEGKRIYVNGVLDALDQNGARVGVQSTTSMIGGDPNDAAHTGFIGAYDEVRIYDAALHAGDINDIALAPYVTPLT